MNAYQPDSSKIQLSLATANAFMQRVFTVMAAGLGITSLTAYLFAGMVGTVNAAGQVELTDFGYSLFGTPLKWLVLFGPVVLALVLQGAIMRLSYGAATLGYIVFTFLMGISLSTILLVYTGESVASTFVVTSAMFGGMAAYGYFTKKDLSGWGSILIMAAWGLFVALIVNMFLGWESMNVLISVIGVIVFCGLTAYDVQNLLRMSLQIDHDSSDAQRLAVLGALHLYINFINIFLFLLRLFGDRR